MRKLRHLNGNPSRWRDAGYHGDHLRQTTSRPMNDEILDVEVRDCSDGLRILSATSHSLTNISVTQASLLEWATYYLLYLRKEIGRQGFRGNLGGGWIRIVLEMVSRFVGTFRKYRASCKNKNL